MEMVNTNRFNNFFVGSDRPHSHYGHIRFLSSKVDHQKWKKKKKFNFYEPKAKHHLRMVELTR